MIKTMSSSCFLLTFILSTPFKLCFIRMLIGYIKLFFFYCTNSFQESMQKILNLNTPTGMEVTFLFTTSTLVFVLGFNYTNIRTKKSSPIIYTNNK